MDGGRQIRDPGKLLFLQKLTVFFVALHPVHPLTADGAHKAEGQAGDEHDQRKRAEGGSE